MSGAKLRKLRREFRALQKQKDLLQQQFDEYKEKHKPTIKNKITIYNVMADCVTIDRACDQLNQFFRDCEKKKEPLPNLNQNSIVMEVADEDVIDNVPFPDPDENFYCENDKQMDIFNFTI